MEHLGDSCLDHVAQNKVLKFHLPRSTPQKNNRLLKCEEDDNAFKSFSKPAKVSK
jgi:hypothetical protein